MKKKLLLALLVIVCVLCCMLGFTACGGNLAFNEIKENGQVVGYSVTVGTARNKRNIEIPSTYNAMPVIVIENHAFENCTSMTRVTIPDSIQSIGAYAFSDCISLKSITIPDSVKEISSFAFRSCSSLISVNIPDGVNKIGSAIFNSCLKLTNITVNEDNFNYYSENNCLVERGSKKLISGCNNSIIPDDIISIGESAFQNCRELTEINIPNGVREIGAHAFEGCRSLTNLIVPNSVVEIGGGAFGSCASIVNLKISVNIIKINSYILQNCTSLKSIEYDGNKAQWKAIEKGMGWNSNTGEYTVHCSDGDISKQGS